MNIIVTGAGRGIGFELCKIFTSNPDNQVIGISRNYANLTKLKKESGSEKFSPIVFDLTLLNYEEELLPKILNHFSSVDILINNAGFLVNKTLENLTVQDFDNQFNTNVKIPFRLIQALLPHFGLNSHIVNIGSMGGFQGSSKFSGLSLYSASKGALAILSECFAEELKPKKVSVNCLALGAVQTEMLDKAFPGYKAPMLASKIAEFIANFALTGHQYFNGKIIPLSLSTP